MRCETAIVLGILGTGAGLVAGCRGAPSQASAENATPPSAPPAEVLLPSAPLFELPTSWKDSTDLAFERQLDARLPPGEERRLSPADLQVLRQALPSGDTAALRAAVILARTRDPEASEVLLARLEERAAASVAGSDAADVVAAAAFAEGTTARDAVARLTALAVGRRAHPDGCVRVECARSALVLGRDDAIPYLLSVLRVGTNAPNAARERWDEADLPLAQLRAAEALAQRAGTVSRFRPEGAVREREEEAARLEGLLPKPAKKR